jgi:hypothetical protein
MQTLKLKLKFDTLRMNQKGSIAGEVWLELGDKSFPERCWSDFPAAVTSALLGATLRLEAATGVAKEEVWFLDGPYCLVLERAQEPTWLVSLRDLDGLIYAQSSVDGSASFASIRERAAELASVCAARSWQHPDIRALNDFLNA